MLDKTETGAEWPMLGLLVLCYGSAALVLFGLSAWSLWLAVPAYALTAAMHSSLTHEAIHGHPSRYPLLNAALLGLPLTLVVPFMRFKDLHLDHHRDEFLTDPYDDPESNYLDPAVWMRLRAPVQAVLRFNNTIAGRMLVGPLIGIGGFILGDMALIRGGDRRVLAGWLIHLPLAAVMVALVMLSPMPLWAFGIGVYGGLSLLRIRTYLEHRAHDKARSRTVVIEDRGPLSLLFLNNNFHVVHHMHPQMAWHRLPRLYAARRDHYLARNDGYRFASYAEVFGRHFLTAKDPVAHPLYSNSNSATGITGKNAPPEATPNQSS